MHDVVGSDLLLTRVHDVVGSEAGLADEALVAAVAAPRLLPCVRLLVYVHVLAVSKKSRDTLCTRSCCVCKSRDTLRTCCCYVMVKKGYSRTRSCYIFRLNDMVNPSCNTAGTLQT